MNPLIQKPNFLMDAFEKNVFQIKQKACNYIERCDFPSQVEIETINESVESCF